MYLYDMNEEAFHLILCNESIDSIFLIPCKNMPFVIDAYSYAYYINEIVISNNKILELLDEITNLCLNDLKILWIDVKEYEHKHATKERKKINVLSEDINIIKYILEYNIYDFSRELELIYE